MGRSHYARDVDPREHAVIELGLTANARPENDMWGRYCCLTSFFLIVDTCLSCEDTADKVVRWCPDGKFLAIFLRPVFSASHAQYISDLHSKFALRPQHDWKCGRHAICDG